MAPYLACFLILLLPLLSTTVIADETLNQDDSTRGTPTSHLNKHMSMFGIQSAEQYSTWETWTHAGQDSDTDESFSENNIPGQTNSGGGKRTFTFTGSAPYPEVVRLDKGGLFSGDFTLTIDCPESQDTCTKDVRIDIMYGQSVIGGVMILGPSEGTTNFYEYNVSHDMDEIEENVTLGVRIEFTKPHDFSGGYILYLGRDFGLDVPALPPEKFVVEVPEGGSYESPYASQRSGFGEVDVEGYSVFTPIVWAISVIVVGVLLIAFFPRIAWKIPATLVTMVGLIISLSIMPVVVMSLPYDEAKMSKSIHTLDQLASLGNSNDQFLTGLNLNDEFQIWIPLDSVYSNNVDVNTSEGRDNMYVYGLGLDQYEDAFSDPGATSKYGLSKIQGFFSLLAINPSNGHGVIIDVKLVKKCGSCSDIVPSWGTTADGVNAAPTNDTVLVSINNGNSAIHVVPESAITVTNLDPTWLNTPLYSGIGAGILFLSIGGFLQYQSSTAPLEWVEDEDEYEVD
ncbi:hypothetical protein OAJ94_05285 [Deltaproteobacteria bacterium]|nr:hypothetical protein [Deltaproteobacteria bacterium]